MSIRRNDSDPKVARGPTEVTADRFEQIKKLAREFSGVQVKELCQSLRTGLPAGFDPIQIGEDEPGTRFFGYQLGESPTDFLQVLAEFNLRTITLRVIACRNAKSVFYQDNLYELGPSDGSADGYGDWNEATATKWVSQSLQEAADIFCRDGIPR